MLAIPYQRTRKLKRAMVLQTNQVDFLRILMKCPELLSQFCKVGAINQFLRFYLT